MKTRIAVLFLFVFAAGCSAAWERSNVTGTQLVADTDACKVAATGGRLELQETLSGSTTLLLPVSELDQRVFGDCMPQRGYARGFMLD